MFLVCFVLYIDVSNVSMRFSVRFCIYEHIFLLIRFSHISFSEVTGMQNLIFNQVAPTALGPISSCRASETNGN